jgi:DNA-binding transcriptional LysR family regulator
VQVTTAVLEAARRIAREGNGYAALPGILADPQVAKNIIAPVRVVGIMNELENHGLVRRAGGTTWAVPR